MTLLWENIRLALFSLKANKMRALLTMLGIIIGIGSVIAIMTVGDSLTGTLTNTMAGLGANNITVYLNMTDENSDNGSIVKDSDFITKDMLVDLSETFDDKITAISLEQQIGSGKAVDGNLNASISISGTSLGYFLLNDTKLLDGRFFSTHETETGSKVCLVSDKLVENMFESDNNKAIGSTISCEVNGKNIDFTVIGVYEYTNSFSSFGITAGKNVRTSVYVPLRCATNLTHSDTFTQFGVMTVSGVNPDDFVKEIKSFFSSKYYLKNNRVYIDAYSMASIVESMSDMMNKLTLGISVIAGIALLVGGIGVMNIMLVSITERTREIGTRKALGAPNSSIRVQFIVESIVICVIGGIIGIILGCLLGIFAANLLDCPASPSVRGIILSITFSMAIGIFFGYYPANKAAKMDPIEALRYE